MIAEAITLTGGSTVSIVTAVTTSTVIVVARCRPAASGLRGASPGGARRSGRRAAPPGVGLSSPLGMGRPAERRAVDTPFCFLECDPAYHGSGLRLPRFRPPTVVVATTVHANEPYVQCIRISPSPVRRRAPLETGRHPYGNSVRFDLIGDCGLAHEKHTITLLNAANAPPLSVPMMSHRR